MATPDTFTILLFADLFLLSFVAIFAFYSYYKKLGELRKVQTEAHKKAEQIIEEAEKRSREILEKVEHKADEILTHSELFKGDLDNAFKASLQKSEEKYLQMIEEHSQKFITDYEALLTGVKNQSMQKAGQALDNIEAEVKKGLAESKTTLKAEVMKSLAKAFDEIEAYKKGETERVDQQIDALVVQMAKELLRINLTPKDHNKLVIQALEKAKEQGMFFL